MLAEQRRQKILELLQAEGRVIAKDLSEHFQMSIDSIRRDLTIMEDQGTLQKTYGGAIPLAVSPKVRTLPQGEARRYGEGEAHQNAISKLAASYIQENDTVFIGGAGIQYGMLKYLRDDIPFTVVTNSIKIAEEVRKKENIAAYLIGGRLRAESAGSIIDTIAIEMISKFTLDIGFVTGGSLDAVGLSTATPEGAAFARAVARVSRRNICLAPHEKVGHRMFISSIPIEEIDTVLTDVAASETAIKEIEKKVTAVVYADQASEENNQ
ncbi:DeoR/GlpR family DNA-binding transcription regulator [Paenibacillus sp. YIM B09110]|uniref:DeoR/GlpR family DNA-binding transcription regulator n=1 Tax=Paenibacillus sp. YIM B09110 TaxID=3126102 RepID=UPI00301C0127